MLVVSEFANFLKRLSRYEGSRGSTWVWAVAASGLASGPRPSCATSAPRAARVSSIRWLTGVAAARAHQGLHRQPRGLLKAEAKGERKAL